MLWLWSPSLSLLLLSLQTQNPLLTLISALVSGRKSNSRPKAFLCALGGIDADRSQNANARRVVHIFSGEKISAAPGTVDLITCAQGAHWLNRDVFYEEARRVLKENGVLCFYGYGIPRLDKPEGTPLIVKVIFLESL